MNSVHYLKDSVHLCPIAPTIHISDTMERMSTSLSLKLRSCAKSGSRMYSLKSVYHDSANLVYLRGVRLSDLSRTKANFLTYCSGISSISNVWQISILQSYSHSSAGHIGFNDITPEGIISTAEETVRFYQKKSEFKCRVGEFVVIETASCESCPPLLLRYRKFMRSYGKHWSIEYTESLAKFRPKVLCDPPGPSMNTIH